MTHVTLHAVYCHSCAAWRLHGHSYSEVADGEFVDDAGPLDKELGPFDGALEVLALGRAWLASVLASSGRPWDAVPTYESLVDDLEEQAHSEQECRHEA